MELLVDIGNSHIRWSDPELLSAGKVNRARTADLQRALQQNWVQIGRPSSLWVSSVADASVNLRLKEWVQIKWHSPVHWVKPAPEQLGVTNGYKNPRQLGVDRWLDMVAAYNLLHQALIVVDCGTATTVDALDGAGHHLGGVILPGLRMMYESLMGQTAMPPAGEASGWSCFAEDTASAIESGALLATAGLVTNLHQCLVKRVRENVQCVLTGGGAEALSEALSIPVRHEPHLVLKGLALVAKQETVA